MKSNRHYQSDIPASATERAIRKFKRKGHVATPAMTECVSKDGVVVGQRFYDADGALAFEIPLKNGVTHGRVYRWDFGTLVSVEPYAEGKSHGTAKQFDDDGRVIGTYKMVHGTGLDVWRSACRGDEVCTFGVSEIRSMKDGQPHGFEWWFGANQRLSSERSWREGKLHGIEREWNTKNRLSRGYPKYWIQGKQVDKRAYMQSCKMDKALPLCRSEDNQPQRVFPARIQKILNTPARRGAVQI